MIKAEIEHEKAEKEREKAEKERVKAEKERIIALLEAKTAEVEAVKADRERISAFLAAKKTGKERATATLASKITGMMVREEIDRDQKNSRELRIISIAVRVLQSKTDALERGVVALEMQIKAIAALCEAVITLKDVENEINFDAL